MEKKECADEPNIWGLPGMLMAGKKDPLIIPRRTNPRSGLVRNKSSVISIRAEGALALIQCLLDQGVAVRIRVSGESMQPALLGGETVQITSLSGGKPKIGEILLCCKRDGSIFIHRLIRRTSFQGRDCVQTKGDSCYSCDEPVPLDHVLGRVRYIFSPNKLSTTSVFLGEVKDLTEPLMRLKSFFIVGRFVIFSYLRKIGGQFVRCRFFSVAEKLNSDEGVNVTQ